MQKCEVEGKVSKCPNINEIKSRHRKVTITLNEVTWKRALADMKDRKEPTLSALVDYLLTCWHYSYNDDCDHCPYVEDGDDGKKA